MAPSLVNPHENDLNNRRTRITKRKQVFSIVIYRQSGEKRQSKTTLFLTIYDLRSKIFYLPQPGIEPRSLDLLANTVAVKAGFYRKAAEVYLYIFCILTFVMPSCDNVLEPSPFRGSGCNTLSHLGRYYSEKNVLSSECYYT